MSWFSDSIRAFLDRGDRLLLAFCLAASGFGLILIYSATRWMDPSAGLRCMLVQVVAIVLGVLVYILMSSVDIELFTEKSWKLLAVFSLAVNLLLFTPLGTGAEETGNNSWAGYSRLSGQYPACGAGQAHLCAVAGLADEPAEGEGNQPPQFRFSDCGAYSVYVWHSSP